MQEEKLNTYEMVNHPTHYGRYDVEVIEMIRRIWGPFITSKWTEITAFKYRQRLGEKPDNPIEQDLNKENVYLGWYQQYKDEWKKGIDFNDLTKEEQEYILSIRNIPKTGKDICSYTYSEKKLLKD